MRTRSMAMIAIVGLTLLSSNACGRGGETRARASDGDADAANRPAVTQAATPETVVMSEPLWATGQGASISEMLKTYPIVFVGHVDSVAQRSVPIYPAGTDFSGPTVEGKPRMSAPGPMLPYSDFSITVLTSIRGDVSAGDSVALLMGGGDFVQPDGQLRRSVMKGDRLLEPGQTYLLFTTRRDNEMNSSPWGKFKITGEGIEPLSDEWGWLGVVQELSGKSISEAVDEIASADER